MDKVQAKKFHQELNSILVAFATKHKVKLKPSNATFSKESFSTKVQFIFGEAAETGVSARERSLYDFKSNFGIKLPPRDVTVRLMGRDLKAVGMTGHGIILWVEAGTNKPLRTNKRTSNMISMGQILWSKI